MQSVAYQPAVAKKGTFTSRRALNGYPLNVGRKLVQGAVVVVETSLRIESLYLAISAGEEEFRVLRDSSAVASPRVRSGLFPGKSRFEASLASDHFAINIGTHLLLNVVGVRTRVANDLRRIEDARKGVYMHKRDR